MTWMAALDYRQGTAHRAAGIPCQDFGRLIQVDENTLIAAMADGAGTAAHSHIGARAAVDAALPWLRARLAGAPGPYGTVSTLSLDALFDGLVGSVQSALQGVANDNRLPLRDLACTLSILAIAPNGVAAAQIGDGFIVTRLAEGDYTLLIDPDRGEYVNETSFITDPDAGAHLRLRSLDGPVRFVSASTDGLTAVSLDNRNHLPHAPFFAPIDTFAQDSGSSLAVHDGIRDFLASERLAQRIDDDLTLMICGWQAMDGP